ncbi:NUDIX hydrolase [Mesobacterium pallidum]|uniref:NUDIX hydrolase n=1 Tax=Mesobacterium pallidum TaxID=2872037 RepID=UPI001EE357CE|nr:NUDIX hydrolase [Mesobacterium pallidum]
MHSSSIRRFGDTPIAGKRYVHRPGAYALLPRGDQLLVTLQTAPGPELQLPGGGIDPGESPVQAIHREVMEETGWRVTGLRRLGVFRRFTWMEDYDIWAEKLCHIYLATPVRQVAEPAEPAHVTLWVHPAEAAENLGSPGDRAFAAWLARGFRRP